MILFPWLIRSPPPAPLDFCEHVPVHTLSGRSFAVCRTLLTHPTARFSPICLPSRSPPYLLHHAFGTGAGAAPASYAGSCGCLYHSSRLVRVSGWNRASTPFTSPPTWILAVSQKKEGGGGLAGFQVAVRICAPVAISSRCFSVIHSRHAASLEGNLSRVVYQCRNIMLSTIDWYFPHRRAGNVSARTFHRALRVCLTRMGVAPRRYVSAVRAFSADANILLRFLAAICGRSALPVPALSRRCRRYSTNASSLPQRLHCSTLAAPPPVCCAPASHLPARHIRQHS